MLVLQADMRNFRDVVGDGAIDLVVSALVLHCVEELSLVFARSGRAFLKKDGGVVLSTPHPIHPARLLEPGYLQAGLIEARWDWLDETMRYDRKTAL